MQKLMNLVSVKSDGIEGSDIPSHVIFAGLSNIGKDADCKSEASNAC